MMLCSPVDSIKVSAKYTISIFIFYSEDWSSMFL